MRISICILVGIFALVATQVSAASLASQLSGRILLQVEDNGEGWYVHPVDQKRRYLGRPADAFNIMRELGLGISNKDLTNLFGVAPSSDVTVYRTQHTVTARRLAGRILLQVEGNGEAYYINPTNLYGYYLGRPSDAFNIMRQQGLGITNTDLAQIVPKGLVPDTEPTNPRSVVQQSVPDTNTKSTPPQTCESNTTPVFTKDFTTVSDIDFVTPPGTIMPDGDVKTHSFIWTQGKTVPIYAPVDMMLASGAYYTEGGVDQYLMFFDVSCEVEIKFDHIHTPLDSIRNELPATPVLNDTRTTFVENKLAFKAGDLIGYTAGNTPSGNWDFGMYNTSVINYLSKDDRFAGTHIYEHAVCPYDYYTNTKKDAFRELYGSGVNAEAPTTFCK